jgi:hypothetical protein
MRGLERRLRALEQRAPAAVQPGWVTVAEWVQWRTTGQQPERWHGSSHIRAKVAEMQARSDAVEQMLSDVGYE